MAAGEYVLTDVKDRRMDFVRSDRKFDGLSMTIRRVKCMLIIGVGDKAVRLGVRSMWGLDRHGRSIASRRSNLSTPSPEAACPSGLPLAS